MKKLVKRWIKAFKNAAKERPENPMWQDVNAPCFM